MLSVKTRITTPGYHYWPGAQNFLRHIHRHLFTFEAEVRVRGSGREVEFFKLQDLMLAAFASKHFDGLYDEFRGVPLSCERMAEIMAHTLHDLHGLDVIRVEVSEDGESAGAWTKYSIHGILGG